MKIAFDDGMVCYYMELNITDKSIQTVANEVRELLAPATGLIRSERVKTYENI